MILTFSSILLAAFICWQDIKTYSLPLWATGLVGVIGYVQHDSFKIGFLCAQASLVLLLFISGQIIEKQKNRPALGHGDIILMTALTAWISLSSWSFFLILSGVFSLLSHLYYAKRSVPLPLPLAPALCGAWLCIIVADQVVVSFETFLLNLLYSLS